MLIAASLVMLSRERPSPTTIPDESIQLGEWLLRNVSARSRLMLRGIDHSIFRSLARTTERLTIPGILNHYVFRKQALERLARAEIARGIQRITILGAGFDTLGCRLVKEFPTLEVREIDHPSTQAWKVRGIQECGLCNSRLTFLAKDLSRAGALNETRDIEPQLWIAEGLLMYFPEARIGELLHEIHRQSIGGSRLAFTFLESEGRPDFRRGSRLVNVWLRYCQEPFAWGILRGRLPDFLASKQFRQLPIHSLVTQEMIELNVGECLALAEAI